MQKLFSTLFRKIFPHKDGKECTFCVIIRKKMINTFKKIWIFSNNYVTLQRENANDYES